jgi:DNA-binding NarL/FixJ family response regulator
MTNKILLYLADDHNIVRRGMARLLKTFSRVDEVFEVANGKELIALIQKKIPDAVILDVEMPILGGMDTAKYISEHFPSVKILILTMHTEEVFVNRLMDSGVHGFLSKSTEPEEVEKALYAILDRDFYRNEIVEKAQSKKELLKEPTNELAKLSSREIEILLLICQELSPGEISRRLNISEKTFFNHRTHILKKTQARSNVGLVKFAHEKGYIKF